jgi:hypothetical protein
MALPKKKSRTISIDGELYQYAISRSKALEDYKFNLTVTVKNKISNGACLIARGIQTRDFWLDFPDSSKYNSDEYKSITPRHIEKIIKLGIALGWHEKLKQGTFEFQISDEFLNESQFQNKPIISDLNSIPNDFNEN